MQTRLLGRVDYLPTYQAMQDFTATRDARTEDALWLCEHNPVFTQGLAGRPEHVLDPGTIPVVATNRGGQVTYHGPGQVVAYPMVDLRRAGHFVKEHVYRIEEAVIQTLARLGVTGHRVAGAPGIYVRPHDPGSHAMLPQRPMPRLTGPQSRPSSPTEPIDFSGLAKIAALGIKISRNCTYHGVALNVAMDLEPFSRINPCGYHGLRTVDLSTIGVSIAWPEAASILGAKLATYLAP